MKNCKLIVANDEIYDVEKYSEDDIEKLLEEYDYADKTELTIDDKCDILDAYDIFDRRAILKSDIYSFYSYTQNRHYAVLNDDNGFGNIIFEIDY